MDNRDKNMTFGNTVISWAIAGLAGFIAFLLFIIMGEWSLSAAAFGGAVIAIILVVLFTIIFGRDLPPLGSVQAPGRQGAATSGQGGDAGSAGASAAAAGSASAASAASSSGSSASSASADTTAEIAGGGAGMGGGAAAATSPAATGTPVGQGAADAVTQREAAAADATAKAESPVAPVETPAPAATAASSADAATAAAAAVPEGAEEKPAGLDAPRDGQADDLKRVKGIGPKLEKLCNSMGFWHFDQIAAWKAEEIAWVDQNLEGFKGRVTRDEWVAQAKALAAGEETAFSKKVDKGGVY